MSLNAIARKLRQLVAFTTDRADGNGHVIYNTALVPSGETINIQLGNPENSGVTLDVNRFLIASNFRGEFRIYDEFSSDPSDGTAVIRDNLLMDSENSAPDEGLAVPSGGVARVLLAELRNDRVDDETAAALRSELGVEGENSREVRLKHLQSEVSDLAAYTDTIESFIDRYGTFGSVVDDVRSELSALEDRTERIDSTVEERAGSIDRIDEIDDELEAIRSTQSELESDLEEIRSTQADFESRFDSLDETITEIDEALDDLELFKERVSEVFRDLRTDDSEE